MAQSPHWYHLSVTDDFFAELEREQWIPRGSRVIVGYSGGADSTCLLTLLAAWDCEVIAAHLNHGLRADADEEELKCAEYATQLGCSFFPGQAKVAEIAAARKISEEEAGRHARYEFFRQCQQHSGGGVIATAHTLDDHLETVLFNLLRGSGLGGLSGIPRRRGAIVRPLLSFSREATRAFCRDRNLWFHDDPGNFDLAHSRVRIREELLPLCESIHPGARKSLDRLARISRAEDELLDQIAVQHLGTTEIPLNGALDFLTKDAEAAFRRDALLHAPEVLRTRFFRLVAEALGGPLDFHLTELLEAGIQNDPQGSITPPGGQVALTWNTERVHIRRLEVGRPYRYSLTVPGITEDTHAGWQITARASEPEAARQAAQLSPGCAALDPAAVTQNLFFRTLEEGDRIQPYGMEGTKPIHEWLGEKGFTELFRKKVPIICDMRGPVWVPGCGIANRVRITGSTQRAWLLELTPLVAPSEDRP